MLGTTKIRAFSVLSSPLHRSPHSPGGFAMFPYCSFSFSLRQYFYRVEAGFFSCHFLRCLLPITAATEGKPETALHPMPRQTTFSASHSRLPASAQAPTHFSSHTPTPSPSLLDGRWHCFLVLLLSCFCVLELLLAFGYSIRAFLHTLTHLSSPPRGRYMNNPSIFEAYF